MKGLNCDSIDSTLQSIILYFFPPALLRSDSAKKKVKDWDFESEIISNKMEIKRCAQPKKYQNQ